MSVHRVDRTENEAMIAFITRDASPGLAIRAAVYEFTEPTVLAAFAKARAAGADVRIVFHDKGDQGQANEDAIKQANLDPAMLVKRTWSTGRSSRPTRPASRSSNGSPRTARSPPRPCPAPASIPCSARGPRSIRWLVRPALHRRGQHPPHPAVRPGQ